MGQLEEKLTRILKKEFPAFESINVQDDDGIIAVLVSREFEGLESIDRQNRIWDVLDRSLLPEERRQVQIIVAATPEEYVGHSTVG
jgi:acid stress-induced BolA-like protein IbaG/YrbA